MLICGKESAYNVGDMGSIWVGKIPWRRERLPTTVFWPEEFQATHYSILAWRIPSDSSQWGHKDDWVTFTQSVMMLVMFS